MVKTIICLANSKKPPSGRCIAGKELINGSFGHWVRPVSARDSREISEDERRYEDGGTAQLFDKILIKLSQPQPRLHQRENYLIDDNHYWSKLGRASWPEVEAAVDAGFPNLWANGFSTNHGQNDKVPELALPQITSSLTLLRIPNLRIRVYLEPGWDGAPGRRRVRGVFVRQGTRYDLSISDPAIEREFLQRADGQYDAGEIIACISLADPFYGYAYKVLASVSNARRHAGQSLLP